MTYASVENELLENGFIFEIGSNPAKGMRFKSENKYAILYFDFNEKKHKVTYYEIIAEV